MVKKVCSRLGLQNNVFTFADSMGGGNMFQETECFDPNTPVESSFSTAEPPPPPPPLVTLPGSTSNSNSNSLEDLSEFHLSPQDCSLAVAAAASSSVHHLHINAAPNHDHHFHSLIHQTFQDPSSYPNNWDNGYQDFVNLGATHTTPDLLSLLQLPRSSLPTFANSTLQDMMMTSSSYVPHAYDPLFHLNFPLQDPSNGSFLGVEVTNEVNNPEAGLIRKGKGSRKRKVFPTERERRVHFKDRFGDLKNLIPNPTKHDRASIVAEAIDYIKELVRTIEDLKMLVEKKRFMKQRNMRGRNQEEERGDDDLVLAVDNTQSEIVEQCLLNKKNNTLRCSWLKRKSKFTEVDVRIIDDEVTIKIVQKKRINSLLFVSKVIDQLKLDLHHVAGGQIGEHHSFLFNTKICEGSCVYASGIADRVIEVLEKQYVGALSMNNGYHCYSSE